MSSNQGILAYPSKEIKQTYQSWRAQKIRMSPDRFPKSSRFGKSKVRKVVVFYDNWVNAFLHFVMLKIGGLAVRIGVINAISNC